MARRNERGYGFASLPATLSPCTSDADLPPLAGRDRTMVRESLHAVRNPELRVILERVMTREIGRRRQREMRKAPGR